MSRVVSIEGDGRDAARAALESCVLGGGVAVFPADGLYGLACDPLNATAIERIHSIKGRDDGKPSAVLYFSGLQMRELFGSLGPRTRGALGALLPGALTLVVANPEHRYPLACREDPERLGLRLLAGPLEGARCALFQTSANRSGEPAPSRYGEIDLAVVEAADVAIDGGQLTGSPSTVVDLSEIEDGGGWSVLREGAVPSADLEVLMAAISVDPHP
jgi:L-threonylcarbamoyladenylate synthase